MLGLSLSKSFQFLHKMFPSQNDMSRQPINDPKEPLYQRLTDLLNSRCESARIYSPDDFSPFTSIFLAVAKNGPRVLVILNFPVNKENPVSRVRLEEAKFSPFDPRPHPSIFGPKPFSRK